MLVGTGEDDIYSSVINSVEIIDLSSSSTTCQDLTDFPKDGSHFIGGLTSKKNPIICGGSRLNDCYFYENEVWTFSPTTKSVRYHAAFSGSPYPNGTIFVTGGFDLNFVRKHLDTAEVLTDSGWQQLPTFIPVTIHSHCMVLINSTTVMIISGEQNFAKFSRNTFYYNTANEKWIEGPKLLFGRHDHSCGMVQTDSQNFQLSVIVAGGGDQGPHFDEGGYLSSVEILDVGASKWRAGPNLPLAIKGASIVESPSGDVLLIGGNSVNRLNTIYKLSHANSEWILLPQKLKVGRSDATAFLVPDEITNCN